MGIVCAFYLENMLLENDPLWWIFFEVSINPPCDLLCCVICNTCCVVRVIYKFNGQDPESSLIFLISSFPFSFFFSSFELYISFP
jgi:hypothetical protein